MKSLQNHLTEYIAARRALGTQLQEPAKTLSGFVEFLARKKAKCITIPLALEWSQQSKKVQRATWARKLSMVRQFARWLSVIEPRHQVPPPRLLNGHESSPTRGGHYRDRALAGTRVHRDDASLSPCRHDDEGKSTCSSGNWQDDTQTLPSKRSAACLPGGPLIMPCVDT